MLEIHPAPDGFTVYDADAGEAVVKFDTLAEADEMVAALQVQEEQAQLKLSSLDAVSATY